MQPADPQQISEWHQRVVANPDGGNVLQLPAFASTKAAHGWQARYYLQGDVALTILMRHIPLLGDFWYLPEGPGVTDRKGLKAFIAAAQTLPRPPFAIRIDPLIPKADITPAALAKLGLVPATRDIQYNLATVVVDLTPTEDDILASFRQKTRYNVRLAAKKGVTVEPIKTTTKTIDQLYDLTAETYQRAGVYIRDRQYYQDFCHHYASEDAGQMFEARYEGQVLAMAFITYAGTKALYMHGASSREHSNVQAPALMQWEIMRWLKAHEISHYDLHGVPPIDRIDDASHPLAGLARFKTGFSSEVIEYIGTYDLVLKPTAYRLWSAGGERVAMSAEVRRHHRLFY